MLSDSSVQNKYYITNDDIYSDDKGKKAIIRISSDIFGDAELNSLVSTYKMLITEHFKSDPPEDNEDYNNIKKTLQSVYDYHNSSERQLLAVH